MNKTVKNADEAISDVKNNTILALGGFGLCGIFMATAVTGSRTMRCYL